MTMTNSKDNTISAKKTGKSDSQSMWVRFSAIMLATALLAGLIFWAFPIKDRMAQKPNFAALAPTTQVIRSQQTPDDDDALSPVEQMERQDSLFQVATKDIVTPHEVKVMSQHKAKSFQKKRHKVVLLSSSKSLNDGENKDSTIVQPTEIQDDHIAISTINANDSTMQFTVDGEVLSKVDNHNDMVITQKNYQTSNINIRYDGKGNGRDGTPKND